ncbi:uncharacterized protein LOC127813211 isoform X2 [Diospyros lotus]|nr:uncharacterized protein LOC127813211 isoform X2 [Diospyros lotus]
MEVQKLVFMQILLLLGIELTLLARSGSCMHTLLLSSEEGKCNSNSDVKTQTTSGFPGLEKYIAETYFRKHDSLVESDFQNFIANELPLGLCQVLQNKLNPVQRLSVHQRHLIGEGSHRRLSSSIRLPIQSLSIPELPRHFCKIIIVERLPSGVFADPFELQHLLLHGVFTEAAVFGDTNLELPSVVSNRSVVEVHMDIGDNILTGLNNGLEISIELPLHARYAPLGERGFSRVEFGEPAIFMHCYIEGMSNDQSCLFLAAAGDAAASPTVGWEVPCGIKGHSGVVSAVTFVSAAVSAFLIVLTSIFYPDIQKSAAF